MRAFPFPSLRCSLLSLFSSSNPSLLVSPHGKVAGPPFAPSVSKQTQQSGVVVPTRLIVGERESAAEVFFLFVVVVVVVDLSLVVSQRRVAVVRPQRASNRTQHSWSPRAQRDSRAGLSFLKRE